MRFTLVAIAVIFCGIAAPRPADAQYGPITLTIDEAAVRSKMFELLTATGTPAILTSRDTPLRLDKHGRTGNLTLIIRNAAGRFADVRQRMALDATILRKYNRESLSLVLNALPTVRCDRRAVSKIRSEFEKARRELKPPYYFDDYGEGELLGQSIRALAVEAQCQPYAADMDDFRRVRDEAGALAAEIYDTLTKGGYAFRRPTS
ncbi:hypothetical protein V5740_07690 [Croceibacterium sp. TMG7-5b_MA50]|uniref:hypothetical protein n=1 Tax=Croceibacterium sp. TMG7-5b_MA50 TaxID=3121290 RepID=UPI0032215B33